RSSAIQPRAANQVEASRLAGAWRGAMLLTAHFACLAAFAWTTSQVIEHGRAAGDLAALWILGWAAAGNGSLVSWALCLMPAGSWKRVAVRGWRGLAASAAVGLVVWGASLFADRLWEPLAAATMWCAGRLLS